MRTNLAGADDVSTADSHDRAQIGFDGHGYGPVVTATHVWMRPVLVALYDELDADGLRSALTDENGRRVLRDQLNRDTLDNGRLGAIPPDQYGENLLHGLLAIRSKFDRETGLAKLEMNLAMRAGGGERQ
jgi:hypothetical protein